MSRGLVINLLASALTILATIAFMAARVVAGSPMTPSPEADGRPVVYAFYDAINAVLRSGDPAPLERVLAPHFVMHGAFAAVSPDRGGLVRQMVATSTIAPNLQLEIEELAVAGDRAVVHVHQASGAAGAFLGAPFAVTPAFWGQFDALRIEGGQVSELWSGEEYVPLLESLRQTRLAPLPTPDQAMRFQVFSAETGRAWAQESTFQSRALYVDAGAITIEVDAASLAPAVIFGAGDGRGQGRPVQPGARAHVQAGEALALAPTVRYRLREDASQPELRVYEVAFPRYLADSPMHPGFTGLPAVGTPPPSELPARELLGEVADTELPHDALVVSFGRIILPPGRSLALAEAPGPVVLTVEAGTLGIDERRADGTPVMARLALGEATIIPTGEATALHVVGAAPVVLFAVTILPAHAGASIVPSSFPSLTGI